MSALALTIASPYAALPCARPTHARLQALLRFWEDAAREAGGLPQRRRFTFDAMVPWLGHLAVWTVEHAPLRFKAALIGTRLVDWDGYDGTGRYLDEIIAPPQRDAAIARYVQVATSGTWYADMARFVAPRTTTATLHRLLLPCADDRARGLTDRNAAVGVRDVADGVRDAADGVRDAAVGVRDAAVGVRDAAVGVRDAAVGVRDAAVGVRDAAVGVRDAAVGVRDAAVGVRDAAVGVRDAAVGVRVDQIITAIFRDD